MKQRFLTRSLLIQWLLTIISVLGPAGSAAAKYEIPKGTIFQVRLATSVSSYSSKVGDHVRAVLIEPIYYQGRPVIPDNTWVEGQVQEVHRVGMGFYHETAKLQIHFTSIQLAAGARLEISAELAAVENAREDVGDGAIKGVRATNTPQGRINSRLVHLPVLNPYSDLALLVFKATFPIFPEPEIYLKPGTDLSLRLTESLSLSADYGDDVVLPATFEKEDEEVLQDLIQSMPTRVMDSNGKKPADITNLLLIGSEADIRQAFSAAGWMEAKPKSVGAVWRNFYAFLSNSAYPDAPMAAFRMNSRPADLNYQKGFSSYAKRHHLRIWKLDETFIEQPIWLASATHDIGATLSIRQQRFYHRVDPYVDRERAKIVQDLAFSGSISKLELIPREGIASPVLNATGEYMATDGKLAVIALQSCRRCQAIPDDPAQDLSLPYRNKHWIVRYIRSQILIYRSDLLRANAIYGVFDLSRLIRRGFRHDPLPDPSLGMKEADR